MNVPDPLPRHFYSLDALRGLAALSVVFWHWQHFSYQGTELLSFSAPRQPLYQVFRPFYAEGWRAVDLFFCLSGFIFFWLYGPKVGEGRISAREFAARRFSRLYPLHLVTLILVAAGQALFLARQGAFFVYAYNDFHHFVLHLLFASSWGFQRGCSFNYPAWSVSIEVLLYFMFFLSCRLGLRRWWHLVLFVAASWVLMRFCFPLGWAMISFFMGGLSFYVVERAHPHVLSRRLLPWLVVTTVLAWLIMAPMVSLGLMTQACHAVFPTREPTLFGRHVISGAINYINTFYYNIILFPLTITTLALIETRRGVLGKRLAFLGHISYSSYLLHFPLQLGFVLLGCFFWPGSFFYDFPVSLGLFFGTLLPLSLCSYCFLERPAQSFLLARLLPSEGPRSSKKMH